MDSNSRTLSGHADLSAHDLFWRFPSFETRDQNHKPQARCLVPSSAYSSAYSIYIYSVV